MAVTIQANPLSAHLPGEYVNKHCDHCNCTESDKEIYKNLFTLTLSEIEPFNWVEWPTLKMYFKDDSIIDQLPREDLLKLVLAHMRGDRYCSGVIDTAIDNGTMMRIAKRVQKIS